MKVKIIIRNSNAPKASRLRAYAKQQHDKHWKGNMLISQHQAENEELKAMLKKSYGDFKEIGSCVNCINKKHCTKNSKCEWHWEFEKRAKELLKR